MIQKQEADALLKIYQADIKIMISHIQLQPILGHINRSHPLYLPNILTALQAISGDKPFESTIKRHQLDVLQLRREKNPQIALQKIFADPELIQAMEITLTSIESEQKVLLRKISSLKPGFFSSSENYEQPIHNLQESMKKVLTLIKYLTPNKEQEQAAACSKRSPGCLLM
jgi:hypothetical protein